FSCVRAQSCRASPAYSSASLRTVSRARPRGLRGRAMSRNATATAGGGVWPRPGGEAAATEHYPRLVQLEVKRRMGEADIAAVSELLHLAAVADEHLPLGEHMWLDLVEGGRTGFAGFVA